MTINAQQPETRAQRVVKRFQESIAEAIGNGTEGTLLVHVQDWRDLNTVLSALSTTPAEAGGASDLADVLAMTGCRDREDLEDMARVGLSLMESIDQLVKTEGPFHGWAPAENPAEIVFDLFNALVDAAPSPPAGDARVEIDEHAEADRRWPDHEDEIRRWAFCQGVEWAEGELIGRPTVTAHVEPTIWALFNPDTGNFRVSALFTDGERAKEAAVKGTNNYTRLVAVPLFTADALERAVRG